MTRAWSVWPQARFVPLRVATTGSSRDVLVQLKLPTHLDLYVALVTPAGELLAQITPTEAADVQALADKLTAGFRRYRDHLFERELRPVLEKADAPAYNVQQACELIERFTILSADRTLAAMLTRSDVKGADCQRIHGLLAVLSTQASVTALLDAARSDGQAAVALKRCQPGALEFLLPHVNGADVEHGALAYEAAASICRLADPKGAGFWKSADERARREETLRLKRTSEPLLLISA